MKTLNILDQLIPYILGSIFTIAMFNLFMALADYIGRNGL